MMAGAFYLGLYSGMGKKLMAVSERLKAQGKD